jgi:hypothetical protein
MKKVYFLATIVALFFLTVLSCKKDDGVDSIPPRDRGEEAIPSTTEIETFLQTHFYNYEEFVNAPPGADLKIKFDTIAGVNASKTPLIEQVSFKNVKDRIDDTVLYKLYYLTAIQGEGKAPNFPDIASISYEGTYLNNESTFNNSELFDSSIIPVRFDLTQVVPGLQDVLIEFQASTRNIENNDGTTTYFGYGVGAAFIPSGLAYYTSTPPGIPVYSQLIFTFQLVETELGDQDFDTIPSIYEDVNNNDNVFDDNTDGDTLPNFVDVDDEGDGRLTKNEVVETQYLVNLGEDDPILASNEVETKRETDEVTQVTTITTITFTDTDNDGTPDYLDPDN